MGRAGIVLGLEVSRLARNSTDWHRLLEICALTDTLILDEDGIYDPAHFNDRLLLGLKGTMSEAELHVLRARLRGGILNKARRGELRCRLPVGFVYDADGRVVLDPDTAGPGERAAALPDLRAAPARRTPPSSTSANRGCSSPPASPPGRARASWRGRRSAWAAPSIALHNPWYAGAYAFGRGRWRKQPDGRTPPRTRCRASEWHVLLRDAHPGYISWEEYERIEHRLQAGSQGPRLRAPAGPAPRRSRPAAGPRRLRTLRQPHARPLQRPPRRSARPRTTCARAAAAATPTPCARASSAPRSMPPSAQLLVDAVTPMALELTLAVQQEIQTRLDEADRLRHRQVERAQYEADHARHRYMQVDPANRLVADSLEADWNAKLRALAEAQEEYQRQRTADRLAVDAGATRSASSRLATDFPAVWRDPNTPQRERKRMLALLIEDVTLIKQRQVTGARPLPRRRDHHPDAAAPADGAATARHQHADVRQQIDALLDEYTDAQVAAILNERGLRTGAGDAFDPVSVQWVRFSAKLKSLKERLLDAGMLTGKQIAATARRPPHDHRPLAARGAPQGAHLQRAGRVALLAPGQPRPSDASLRATPPRSTSTDISRVGGAV